MSRQIGLALVVGGVFAGATLVAQSTHPSNAWSPSKTADGQPDLQGVWTNESLTTLAGDDTPARVQRLCAKARNPLRRDLAEALGLDHVPSVGAVCGAATLAATAVQDTGPRSATDFLI